MNDELRLRVGALMGWTDIEHIEYTTPLVGSRASGHFGTSQQGETDVDLPGFEIDERDSGLILDRIAALGWGATVHTGPHDAQIVCCIMRMPGDVIRAEAKTRPMAICLAFVQAMERWNDD